MKSLLFVIANTPVFLSNAVQADNLNEQSKPNILWVTIEDTSPQFIGCYGDKYADTPNIDRLAEEGVRFTNAFSTGTVCSPSRTAIITGVKTYKTGTGNHRSKHSIPEFIKGFPFYLQKEGYYTTNNVKEPFIETIKTVRAVEGQDYNVAAACLDFLGSLGLVPNNPDYRR